MSRKLFVRLHRYAGLMLVLFLTVAGLTGASLAFYHELDEWLNPDWMLVTPTASSPVPLAQLARKVSQAYPDHRIARIEFQHSTDRALIVRMESKQTGDNAPLPMQVFVNPYTNDILGAREWGKMDISRRGLMPFLFKLHDTLHLPGKVGKWLLGGIAILWLLDCFVGFYLALPRHGLLPSPIQFMKKWAPAWKIKYQANATRVNFDVHRASGLWLWPVLAVVAFSSFYLNLNREVFRPVMGMLMPFSPLPGDTLPKVKDGKISLDWDAAYQRGLALRPAGADDYRVANISYLAKQNVYRLTFDERQPNAWLTFKREQVFFDANTGELKAQYGYAQGTTGDRLGILQYPLHTGQIFGLPGRILILFTGLLTALLAWTGVFIWFRKRQGPK
ncbi:PepSY-associated TM helix domain-containing protein [Methylovorus mays]|uniref:PepSY-associated TM helix domain-containing protein n=1 Tax=Methylovorus mays TaxID=184077 RepID=UPI001E5A4D73|nr:PepSY-associated TM helix domain-containing protein [Methylovorus mays]MCB5207535.1 PepSY domain-containing protein [Methylovorus mays]